MKAIGATHHLPVSDPDCLVEFDAPKPEIGPKDILVKVAAVGINPVDTKIRMSLGDQPAGTPRILGWDAAGTVEETGSEVGSFRKGDEVYYAGDVTRAGSNAEYQAVDSRLVARKPASFSFAQAAALPLVGITAWELLLERMIVRETDETTDLDLPILIINGAGGVGSAMIPLARMLGMQVVATASRKKTTKWCHTMGACEVINHRKPLVAQVQKIGISEFPYIANLYHTDQYWETMGELVAPMGAIGCIVEPEGKLAIGDPLKAKCVRIAWEFMFARSKFKTPDMHRQGLILNELAELCEDGLFPNLVTRTLKGLTAKNLIEAHELMEESSMHGKLVIEF
ncbi:MAG: zinc-binding alcohol dehydrogenase family protein [Akkermansiaceae bacterium]|nr:zinc-binding alcohol dehydrogenase family protein [Akkermansiaceae bacterium]